MNAAIDVISENIPDLEALNLNDNKLNLLDHLKVLRSKLPLLKILYLGNNKVSGAFSNSSQFLISFLICRFL